MNSNKATFNNARVPFMPAQDLIQSGSQRAIRHGRRILAGSMAAVRIVHVDHYRARISAATLRSTSASPEQRSDQIVNRMRKSDRQLALHELRQINPDSYRLPI